MSRPSPYTMTIGEDGLSIRCEWDVHYFTDEQLETVRKHVETLQAENAKLRELVRDLWLTGSLCDAVPDVRLQARGGDWRTMRERVDEALGIEVDA